MQNKKISYQQVLTDNKGNRMGVILSMRQFQKLQEDLYDLSVIAERKEEKIISYDDMLHKMSSV